MSQSSKLLALWQRLASKPGGKRLFSRLVAFKAPYFATIRARIRTLEPGRCEVTMRKRRAVQNHIGTVHAIAMCNMAELAGGTMAEVTVPAGVRWIPRGMRVEYRARANTDLVAVATPQAEPDWSQPSDYPVQVDVRDRAGETVLSAFITMYVSPKPA